MRFLMNLKLLRKMRKNKKRLEEIKSNDAVESNWN
jgi:hypothetical protein